jgi:secretion/DNA translocation related CpaE-like protein
MDDLARPLVVTADDQLLDQVLRLCAAVGVTPTVAADARAAARAWRTAGFVVAGADAVGDLARAGLGRRASVFVATTGDASYAEAFALGAELLLTLPADEDRAVEAFGAATEGRGEACVVSVTGACGGAGASTLAAVLALTAGRRGLRTLLLDADELGGGLDLLLGREDHEGLRWSDVDATPGRLSGESLRRVLPSHDGVWLLSWGRDATGRADPAAMAAVLSAAARSFDLVVVDLPRRVDPWASAALARSTLAAVVVPGEVRGLAGATRLLAGVRAAAPAAGVLVRTRPRGLDVRAVAEAVQVPVLGRLRDDRRLAASVDLGDGPGRSRTHRRCADALLEAVGLRGDR